VPDFFCEKVTPYCDTKLYTELKASDYAEKMVSDKPAIIKDDDYVQKIYDSLAKDTKARTTVKLLHLADAHYDLNYAPGTDAQCGEMDIICCREGVGIPKDPKNKARPTGEYRCDLPYPTIEAMGDFINKSVKPDMVVWTGDITPHNIWEYTLAEVQHYTTHFSAWMQNSLSDFPVYPVEGNHDFELANSMQYTPKDPMVAFTLEHWKQWLDADA